jgi:two-component system phosphate regulon response regulator PhoB
MARILIIEDEADLQEVLAYNLSQAGHEPLSALQGRKGLELARERSPDMVLLDLMLPDIPGTEVCRALKADPATRSVPVVMLTARAEELDRIAGFELGADDYVVKPFSVRELVLRIGAVLRRGAPCAGGLIEVGLLRIDREAHRVWVGQSEVELTGLELRLLLCLFERRNRVQSRDALLDEVWGAHADVTPRTVDTQVKRLREKLGEAGAYIETVRGTGYRFAQVPAER